MSVENLITEHLDIWTSAVKSKSAAGRGTSKKLELVGIKKLRELILELAVRGKLVPQDPNDEPASELLQKINVEKARLVKQGKLKKQKPLPQIEEEEKSIVIPTGWCWERLENVINQVTDGEHLSPKKTMSGVKLLTAKHVRDDGVTIEDPQYVSEEDAEKFLLRCKPEMGDILICSRGTIGRTCVNEIEDVYCLMGSVILLKKSKEISSYYLSYFIKSPTGQLFIRGVTKGMAVNALYLKDVKLCPMPIPPFAEQHRIVAKVDELMALCDQLEAQTENSIQAHQLLVETLLATLTNAKDADELSESWQRISQHFDVLFTTQESIDQLKHTILQLAVMGKLVKQNPNDEPASKLLKQIAEEKEQLIKDGKIKKQKPLPSIADVENPFELPKGWEWVYLNNLLPQFQNGASSRGDKSGKEVVVLRLADIKNWEISLEDTRVLAIDEEKIKRYSLKKGDVLIIRVNGSAEIVGRFIQCDSEIDAIYCDHFIRMRFPLECLFTPYLSILGSSDLIRSRIANLFVSTAGQKTVNQTHISTLPISLPPFEEQIRIVAKADELIELCDSLKHTLNQTQVTHLQLTDTLVENAL